VAERESERGREKASVRGRERDVARGMRSSGERERERAGDREREGERERERERESEGEGPDLGAASVRSVPPLVVLGESTPPDFETRVGERVRASVFVARGSGPVGRQQNSLSLVARTSRIRMARQRTSPNSTHAGPSWGYLKSQFLRDLVDVWR